MKIQKIGIRFGDNDFGSTFQGILGAFADAHKYKGSLHFTREQILELINATSYYFYVMFQNPFEYHEEKDGKLYPESHTAEYLKIKLKQIHLNDEVDEYLNAETTFLDGDYHVIDFTVFGEPYIYST